MKIEEILVLKLKEFSRRYRAVQLGKALITSLCYGLSLYLALCGLDKFIPLSLNWPALFLTICGLSIIIGLVLGRYPHISLFSIACQVEQKLALKERISTAWEYKDQRSSNEWVPLLIRDAVRCLQEVKSKRVFPHHWLRKGKYIICLSVSILLLSFFPHLPPFLWKNLNSPAFLPQRGGVWRELASKLIKKERPEHPKPTLASRARKLQKELHYRKLFKITQGRLLEELKVLIEEGKGEFIDQKRLSWLKEALKRDDYEKISSLLQELSTEEGISANRAKMMRKSYQQVKEDSFPQRGGEEMARATQEKGKGPISQDNGKTRGYSQRTDENFLPGQKLNKKYSSLPGHSPSFETQEEKVLEFDGKGNLVKVRGQFDQGSFLMSLLRSLSPSSDGPGLSTEEALFSYTKLMMNKLSREKIPLSYKEQVKNYFSSLEPE